MVPQVGVVLANLAALKAFWSHLISMLLNRSHLGILVNLFPWSSVSIEFQLFPDKVWILLHLLLMLLQVAPLVVAERKLGVKSPVAELAAIFLQQLKHLLDQHLVSGRHSFQRIRWRLHHL